MPTWNLHVIGHAIEDELETLAEDLVKHFENSGHVLDSAVLTTDQGPRDLHIHPWPAHPDVTDPPALEEAPKDEPPNAVPEGDTNPVAVSEETPSGASSTDEGGGDS